MNPIESAIRQSVKLGRANASGFHPVTCKVCNDYKVRAAFKFEADGSIIYNCFRGKCTANAVYKPNEGGMTHKFRDLLKAFGVDIPMTTLLDMKAPKLEETLDEQLYEKHSYQEVLIPQNQMTRYDPSKHHIVRDFLAERHMDDMDYYVGTAGVWANRLIMPMYHYDKLIGWQSRVIVNYGKDTTYEKSSQNTDLLWLPDGRVPDEPIVVEGIFDAKSIPFGVATLSSTITKKQAYFLRDKKPILLPDRKGSRFLEAAKLYGWRIIIPPWKEKDANAAMCRYGRLAIALMMRDNIVTSQTSAELKYAMWAQKNPQAKAPYVRNTKRR